MDIMRIFVAFCIFFYNVYGKKLPYGYHMKVGVPKAEALKSLESARIIGGTQVQAPSAIPHHSIYFQPGILSILTTGWTSVCGGSLISNTRVLTAAHCWWDGRNQARFFTVVLGSITLFSGGIRIDTSDVIVHSNWNPNSIIHDIAMVRISSVGFNTMSHFCVDNIQAVPLPGMDDVNRDFVGLTATVSGFGKTSDAQTSFPVTTALHQTSMTVISNAVCQSNSTISVHGSHLCTGGYSGRGTCDGDSGGPLTAVRNNQRILIGIVTLAPTQGCEFGFPSKFTRVTSFINWINWIM